MNYGTNVRLKDELIVNYLVSVLYTLRTVITPICDIVNARLSLVFICFFGLLSVV